MQLSLYTYLCLQYIKGKKNLLENKERKNVSEYYNGSFRFKT